MRVLLDSHALLWWWFDPTRLSETAVVAISDELNVVLVSAATAWEIATKHRIGKLPEIEASGELVDRLFSTRMERDGFQFLAISHRHGLRSGSYEVEHRDPFDRLLAAQSEIEQLVLVTRDPAFASFPCETLW